MCFKSCDGGIPDSDHRVCELRESSELEVKESDMVHFISIRHSSSSTLRLIADDKV